MHNENSPVDSNTQDVALMRRVAKGDEAAFSELVEKHQYAVVGTVAKMLGSASDAEDIAQQVFIRIWKSAPKYEPKAKFTTFMYTITRNLVFSETRRKKVRKQVSVEEQGEEWGTQYADHSASPEQQYLKDELMQAVDRAISNLPETQRMAIILRKYENMPYEEIAKVLNLSVSAVKSQLFRARTELKEELSNYLGES